MNETGSPDDVRELAWSAVNHAYLYAAAVRSAADRILTVSPGEADQARRELRSSGRLIDAMMLVLALRNVLRAGEMAAKYIDGDGDGYLTSALARFREQLPGIKAGRDVLEHFDEYLAGTGRRRDVPYDLAGRLDGTDYFLTVGGVSVSVLAARDAASFLALGLISFMERESG